MQSKQNYPMERLCGKYYNFCFQLIPIFVTAPRYLSCRRPTGQPSKDLLAYDMPALQQHKEELLRYLKEQQAANELEKASILKKVEGIKETEKAIEDILAKNKKTCSVLGST